MPSQSLSLDSQNPQNLDDDGEEQEPQSESESDSDTQARRGGGGGAGGGAKRKKPPSRKQKAKVEKKLRLLSHHLRPIPFSPSKTVDLSKHQSLLKTLGIWDFATLDLGRDALRPDLLSILIANYDPAGRRSYVHDHRINVSRADLARALHLPVKKDRSDPSLNGTVGCEESIAVISEFVSNYMLLHEDDAWMMPEEVMPPERLVKEGRFEKVDWAGLMWFMVERELLQAPESGSCYYAAHLQRLIRSQKPDLLREEDVEEVSVEEDEDTGADKVQSLDDFGGDCLEDQQVDLSLGHENGQRERTGEDNLMEFQECKEVMEGEWFLNERNIGVDHSLRHCNLNVIGNLDCEHMDKELEEESYENPMKSPELERLESAELNQEMDTGNVSYGLAANIMDPSSSDFLTPMGNVHKNMLNAGGLPMFRNACKRKMNEEDEGLRHIPRVDHNRNIRMNGPWEHRPEGFLMCMEHAQSWLNRARAMHEDQEEAYSRAQMNVEYLVAQVQQRERIIHSMEKSMLEERNKRHVKIYKLERELCIMTHLIHGYKKALKETRAQFAEYRERFQQLDEPIYKDVGGNGGGVLSIVELEKQRLTKEEEDRKMCFAIEEKINAFEQEWFVKLDSHVDRVDLLDKRLLKIVEEVGLLKENSKTKHLTT